MKQNAVVITKKATAELITVDAPDELGPQDVRGKTLVSLISPGTELNYFYYGDKFPGCPGYATVFEVEEIGSELEGVKSGDVLFSMGRHKNIQQVNIAGTIPVPKDLPPEKAVIARLMGITMTTLMITEARPGDTVLVTGAGPVGFLGAHIFRNAGYDVHVIEPDEERRNIIKESGINKVYPSVPNENSELSNKVALVLECSGHEQALLDACQMVRKRGEAVLVGVPWKKRTELSMFDLLHVIFHRYIVLRSGWEWELPTHKTDTQPHSIFGNFKLALKWIQENRIPLDNLISLHSPENAGSVYDDLAKGKSDGFFIEFDWRTG